MRRAQRMFFSSSKRAFSSTSTVTCLPASAAATQRARDRRVLAGPVERLLDRQHARVLRGLLQEVDHAVERIERVVQQHVARADRREQLRRLAQRDVDRRHEARRLQAIVRLQIDELDQPRDVDRAVALDQVAALEVEHLEEFLAQPLGDGRAHLESHRIAAAPATQLVLDRGQQVLGFFLVDVEIRVARHAERGVIEDLRAREELR